MSQTSLRQWRLVPRRGWRRTFVLGLLAGLAVSVLGVLSAGTAEAYVRGVDVSNWQGSVDWSRVAASGEQFAFAKATEGNFYTDPWYSANRLGARANGLRFGAYHFAKPSGSTTAGIRNDAYAEADRFVNQARLGSGFLLPVLDLESTGGLGTWSLKYWVQSYLARIQYRLGVKGIIYTYPSFWRTYMGNATWFAANGYKVLWIPTGGVSTPTSLPANNWNGYWWTFWQWTSCGSVPGIRGCVDRNYYHYSTFTQVLIP